MVALLIMAKYIPYGEIVHLTAEECRVHGAELGAWLAKESAAEGPVLDIVELLFQPTDGIRRAAYSALPTEADLELGDPNVAIDRLLHAIGRALQAEPNDP